MTETDSYYKALDPGRRAKLEKIHQRILTLYPEVEVSLKYRMPTFEINGKSMSIGNQKAHIAVYTSETSCIESYLRKHSGINAGKGCLRFRDTQEVDLVDLETVIKTTLG